MWMKSGSCLFFPFGNQDSSVNSWFAWLIIPVLLMSTAKLALHSNLLSIQWIPETTCFWVKTAKVWKQVSECGIPHLHVNIQGRIQKFLDWPPRARTANGTALCHWMQLYCYSVNQSSEFCCHNPMCCFSVLLFYYRLSLGPKWLEFNIWEEERLFSSQPCPDWLWGLPSFLFFP
jgi:hypothetical protein